MIRKEDDLHMDRGSFSHRTPWRVAKEASNLIWLRGKYRPIVRKRPTPDVLSKFFY